MDQVSVQGTETSIATRLAPLNAIIAQGSFIHATLESASNSDLPGYLRATVSEPTYAEDGSQVLIPKGSRLIGQYKSGMLQGQSRIFVVWTRIITPDGISVQLGSPGVDSLGVAGMEADSIDRHFWQRFGTASLLSLIGAGAATAGVNSNDQDNSAAYYREALASSFAQSADQSLQQESRIAPTLKSHQGKSIKVFIARDLNFQSTMNMTRPKLNIF
jgi:type IV secretion system protein VirB10